MALLGPDRRVRHSVSQRLKRADSGVAFEVVVLLLPILFRLLPGLPCFPPLLSYFVAVCIAQSPHA